MLWYTILFLHIALIPIYLGIWSVVPSYVQTFSNWIHLVVGLYLLIRFRPFQGKIDLHSYDIHLIFSAGLFMIQALIASVLLESPWGGEITVYLAKWKDTLLSWLPDGLGNGIKKKGEGFSKWVATDEKSSDAPLSEPTPKDTVSSLGNSIYTPVE